MNNDQEARVWATTYASAFAVYVQESNHRKFNGEMHLEASVFAKDAADYAVQAYRHSCGELTSQKPGKHNA